MRSDITPAQFAAELKAFLLQEHALDGWLYADRENYLYFKEEASTRKAPPKPVVQQKTLPPPPKAPLPPLKRAILQQQNNAATTPPKREEKTAQKEARVPIVEIKGKRETQVEDLADIKAFFIKHLPDVAIIQTPPEDTIARSLKGHWKESISKAKVCLLTREGKESQEYFHTALTEAINQWLTPACHLLVNDYEVEELKNLTHFVAAKSSLASLKDYDDKSTTLKKRPVILIDDALSYISEPFKKKELWEQLKQMVYTASI